MSSSAEGEKAKKLLQLQLNILPFCSASGEWMLFVLLHGRKEAWTDGTKHDKKEEEAELPAEREGDVLSEI